LRGRHGCEDITEAPVGKTRETAAAGNAAPEGVSLPADRKNSRLTVLSGPSGVGKSTVGAALRRRSPESWISASVTTRRPRPGEVKGREYHCGDTAEFARMVFAGKLLEWRSSRATNTAHAPNLCAIDVSTARRGCLRSTRRVAGQVREGVAGRRAPRVLPPPGGPSRRRADATLVNASTGEVCRQMVTWVNR
jgi:Guanylate kinase